MTLQEVMNFLQTAYEHSDNQNTNLKWGLLIISAAFVLGGFGAYKSLNKSSQQLQTSEREVRRQKKLLDSKPDHQPIKPHEIGFWPIKNVQNHYYLTNTSDEPLIIINADQNLIVVPQQVGTKVLPDQEIEIRDGDIVLSKDNGSHVFDAKYKTLRDATVFIKKPSELISAGQETPTAQEIKIDVGTAQSSTAVTQGRNLQSRFFSDGAISSQHFTLYISPTGEHQIMDLKSTNGTLIVQYDPQGSIASVENLSVHLPDRIDFGRKQLNYSYNRYSLGEKQLLKVGAKWFEVITRPYAVAFIPLDEFEAQNAEDHLQSYLREHNVTLDPRQLKDTHSIGRAHKGAKRHIALKQEKSLPRLFAKIQIIDGDKVLIKAIPQSHKQAPLNKMILLRRATPGEDKISHDAPFMKISDAYSTQIHVGDQIIYDTQVYELVRTNGGSLEFKYLGEINSIQHKPMIERLEPAPRFTKAEPRVRREPIVKRPQAPEVKKQPAESASKESTPQPVSKPQRPSKPVPKRPQVEVKIKAPQADMDPPSFPEKAPAKPVQVFVLPPNHVDIQFPETIAIESHYRHLIELAETEPSPLGRELFGLFLNRKSTSDSAHGSSENDLVNQRLSQLQQKLEDFIRRHTGLEKSDRQEDLLFRLLKNHGIVFDGDSALKVTAYMEMALQLVQRDNQAYKTNAGHQTTIEQNKAHLGDIVSQGNFYKKIFLSANEVRHAAGHVRAIKTLLTEIHQRTRKIIIHHQKEGQFTKQDINRAGFEKRPTEGLEAYKQRLDKILAFLPESNLEHVSMNFLITMAASGEVPTPEGPQPPRGSGKGGPRNDSDRRPPSKPVERAPTDTPKPSDTPEKVNQVSLPGSDQWEKAGYLLYPSEDGRYTLLIAQNEARSTSQLTPCEVIVINKAQLNRNFDQFDAEHHLRSTAERPVLIVVTSEPIETIQRQLERQLAENQFSLDDKIADRRVQIKIRPATSGSFLYVIEPEAPRSYSYIRKVVMLSVEEFISNLRKKNVSSGEIYKSLMRELRTKANNTQGDEHRALMRQIFILEEIHQTVLQLATSRGHADRIHEWTIDNYQKVLQNKAGSKTEERIDLFEVQAGLQKDIALRCKTLNEAHQREEARRWNETREAIDQRSGRADTRRDKEDDLLRRIR